MLVTADVQCMSEREREKDNNREWLLMKWRKTQEKYVQSREKERKTSRDDKDKNNNNNGHKWVRRESFCMEERKLIKAVYSREGGNKWKDAERTKVATMREKISFYFWTSLNEF